MTPDDIFILVGSPRKATLITDARTGRVVLHYEETIEEWHARGGFAVGRAAAPSAPEGGQ